MKHTEDIQDDELVTLAVGGDREAYRELVERYQQRAYAIAYGVVRNREDAEDVVQEAFVKAYLGLKKFKRKSSFYTWLYRIVYHMALDLRRHQARRGGAGVELEDHHLHNADESTLGSKEERPDQQAESTEDMRLLQHALSQLSEEHRVVLLLREVEGLSYSEIAEVLNLRKGTVMSRLFYARKEVKKVFDKFEEEGSMTVKMGTVPIF